MKDWLSKRNLGDGDASRIDCDAEKKNLGDDYEYASRMERDGKDVVQNVAEIVGSFNLEVEEQQLGTSECWRTSSRSGKSGVQGTRKLADED